MNQQIKQQFENLDNQLKESIKIFFNSASQKILFNTPFASILNEDFEIFGLESNGDDVLICAKNCEDFDDADKVTYQHCAFQDLLEVLRILESGEFERA